MEKKLYPFKYVLINIERFPWDALLYLPKEGKWTLESPCAILMPDLDVEDEEADPEFAVQNNLRYALLFSDLQQIVENAKEQIPNANEELLFKAFMFYYDNDAFIEFTDEAP